MIMNCSCEFFGHIIMNFMLIKMSVLNLLHYSYLLLGDIFN